MKKDKIIIPDIESFFIDDVLKEVKCRKKARKELKNKKNEK